MHARHSFLLLALTAAVVAHPSWGQGQRLLPGQSLPLQEGTPLAVAPQQSPGQSTIPTKPAGDTPSSLPGLPNFAPEASVGSFPSPANPDTGTNSLDWQILNNPKGSSTVIVFDRSQQVLAVYQIDPDSGLISLKSVRKLTWDLGLEHFNTNKPTPQDLRGMNP